MPESRSRKKRDYQLPATRSKGGATAAKRVGNRWAAPLMLACWLLGLAWVSVYYVAGADVPVMQNLGSWNVLIGMGLIAFGFVFATRWE